MVTTKTIIVSEYEIIKLRDTMELSKLKEITDKCKKDFGYVDYRGIFKTMGYTHAYNDKWYKS